MPKTNYHKTSEPRVSPMSKNSLKDAEKLMKKAEKIKEKESRQRLFQEALRVFEASLKLSRNGEDLVGMARCLSELGRIEEARATLDEALQILPEYGPALKLKEKLD